MTRKWGRMATYPKLGNSQFSLHEERPHGDSPHSMRVYLPSPNRPYPWSSGERNLGPYIEGEMGFVAILGNTAKIHPKVVTRKNCISVSQERYASGFCMDANRSFASLLGQGLGFKALEKHF